MKKVLSMVVAIAMMATLAISAVATFDVPLKGEGVYGDVTFHVTGSSAEEAISINRALIRGIKFTFNFANWGCTSNSDENDDVCNKKCIGAGWGGGGGVGDWNDEQWCYLDKQSLTVDLSAYKWEDGPDESTPGTGMDWLQVTAASFVEKNDGSVKIDILGEGGVVLAKGQQTLGGGGGGGGSVKTGVEGVIVLGGVAVLAAGAIVVSRKRR